jgi:hypothetical protein
MKKILISIFLSASATEALAQSAAAETAPWFPITSAMYALSPLEDKKIALSASIDTNTHLVAIKLIDFGGAYCAVRETSAPSSISPISVDGQFLKFTRGCINGTGIVQPESEQGKKFLLDKVQSEKPFLIDAGANGTLPFASRNFSSVIKKLQQVQNAF